MASTYSPSLRIELIGAGDQAGTWNTTTNSNLGTIIESAIAGYVAVSVTSANQAFTALDGAADQARNAVIALTTTTGANFAVYAPPQEKTYVIYNTTAFTATIYNSTVLGNTTAAGSGIAVPAGKKLLVFSDGTNFFTTEAANLTGVLAVVNGGTGVATLTGIAFGNGTGVFTAATAAQVVATISTTAVANATNATNAATAAACSGNSATATTAASCSGNSATATNATTAGRLSGTNWSTLESGGFLYFQYNGTSRMRLDSSGNLVVSGNVTGYGSI
jgi:hypothetical protein